MNRWNIGDVTVTRFVEMETVSKATFILPQATPKNVLTENDHGSYRILPGAGLRNAFRDAECGRHRETRPAWRFQV